MLSWLKQKFLGTQEDWLRAQQIPGAIFPFPKGIKLKPEEEVILALLAALIMDHEKIGSVLLCDDDAEVTLNQKAGAWYVKMKLGMTVSLAKSCQIMLVAVDRRPRFFQIRRPDKKHTEPGAPPNSGPDASGSKSEVVEGPRWVT